jgi:glycosyltransferase involved in cell wall biosynthesis
MHISYTIANNGSVPYFSWFMQLAQAHKELHFSFVVLDKMRPDLLDEVKKYGYDAYWIPFDAAKRKTSMLKALLKLFRLFRRIKPDVVHAHLFDDAVPSIFAAKLAGVKKRIITKQDTAFHYYYAPKWVKMDRFNNRNATKLIAVSTEARDFMLQKEKCPEEKIAMIHHGIAPLQFLHADKAEVERIRKQYAPNNEFLIGTLARFIEWKKYKDIVEAASLALEKNTNFRFVFWGNGEQKEEIQELIFQKKLEDKIIIADYYPRDKIQNVYYALDAYLHAAFMEPFGFVLAEAMFCGLPVISTPTGAAKDAILHKGNGYLAEYNNPSSLAAGIDYFYHNKVPKPWEKAQKTALKMFKVEKMFEEYIKLYKE